MIYAVILTLAFAFSFLFWRMARLHDELADMNQLVHDMLLANDRQEQVRLAREHLDEPERQEQHLRKLERRKR